MNALSDTDSWDYPLFTPAQPPLAPPVEFVIEAAGASHAGHVRPHNEDHFLIARFGRFLECVQSNLPAGEIPPRHQAVGHALLVADGLGGHAAGETASSSALRTLYGLVVDTPDWILRVDQPRMEQQVERRAQERMAQISQVMTEQADADSKLRGFATTLTLAWGLGDKWFVAHVGDSRVYLFRQGALQQITRDHTVAQELADTGLIAQDHVALHPLRNRLTRLLGDNAEHLAPQVKHFTAADGDTLLLCSDGLTDMIDDELISEILGRNLPSAESAQQLIDAALEAGGRDNVTAIVARLTGQPDSLKQP